MGLEKYIIEYKRNLFVVYSFACPFWDCLVYILNIIKIVFDMRLSVKIKLSVKRKGWKRPAMDDTNSHLHFS